MIQTLLFCMQGIPEIAGIIACSLALGRVKLRWGLIFLFAGILTVLIYIIRNMPVTFGMHTVAGILLCALFIARFTRVTPSLSFLVVFASSSVIALLELAMNEWLSFFLHSEASRLVSDDFIWELIGLPQALILIALALAIAKFRKPLEGMWKI